MRPPQTSWVLLVAAVLVGVICSGRAPAAQPSPVVEPREARGLLGRWQDVRTLVREGRVPEDHTRAAAMVLVWGQFLHDLLFAQDEARVESVRTRAQSPEQACQELARALADFDAQQDVYGPRRGGFHSAYVSTLDSSGQLYYLYVPPGYDPGQDYPLCVRISRWRDPPIIDSDLDYFAVWCDGRGQGGYEGVAELDILETIEDVRRHYHIDPNRIYVSGSSICAWGTWRLITRYPDLFAAAVPTCGWTSGLYFENLANVPIWNLHDDTNFVVPVDESRMAVSYLKAMGHPVIYTEVSGGGHSLDKKDPAWDMDAWLFRQRRDPNPRFVHYTTVTPNRGRAYWLEILEFTDPNQPAVVKARVLEDCLATEVFLNLKNIDVIAVSLPPELFPADKEVAISVNSAPLSVQPPLPPRVYVHRNSDSPDGAFAVSRGDPRPPRPYRPYVAGGFNGMYMTAEPLMIVKATGGDDRELLQAVDKFCNLLSRRSTAWWVFPMGVMQRGEIPVKADIEVTDEDIRRCNLIIVGPASANRLLARITPRLPAVEKDGVLTIGGEAYPLRGKGYGLYYYNPEAPNRLIVVISSPEAGRFYDSDNFSCESASFGCDIFTDVPCSSNGIIDRMADERPFGLVLNELDPPRRVRRIMWNKDWQAARGAFDEERLPEAFAVHGAVADLMHRAMCKATGADFAAYWTEGLGRDKPLWDVRHARWHDLQAELGPPASVYTSLITGAQLAAALQAFREKQVPIAVWPPTPMDQINPQATYKICMGAKLIGSFVRAPARNLENIEFVRVDLYQQMRRLADLDAHQQAALQPR